MSKICSELFSLAVVMLLLKSQPALTFLCIYYSVLCLLVSVYSALTSTGVRLGCGPRSLCLGECATTCHVCFLLLPQVSLTSPCWQVLLNDFLPPPL